MTSSPPVHPKDHPAEETAREARDHPAVDWPARVGFLAYGVVYLLVGWLAAQLAVGDRAGAVSGEGALHEVAQQPLGAVALWLAAAGFGALTVWEVCQAIGGHRDRDGVRRLLGALASAGRGVVFGFLAVLSVRTATGDSGGGGTDGITAELMALPAGPLVVAAVGVAIVVVGLNSVHKGLSDRWRRELEVEGRTGTTGTVVRLLARVGHVTRGVAFGVVGGLFVWAAATHDADRSGGLDEALRRLRDDELGPTPIVVVAVGLACYGTFNIVKAWYLRGR